MNLVILTNKVVNPVHVYNPSHVYIIIFRMCIHCIAIVHVALIILLNQRLQVFLYIKEHIAVSS